MMTISKRFNIKLFLLLIILVGFSHSPITKAAGIPTIDIANITQTTVSAIESVEQRLKQIEQYTTQLQQYEEQLKNTAAPAAYIWSKAQYTMNRLVQASNTLKYYQTQGGVDSYLNRYRNASYYSNSPCFGLDAECSRTQWNLMREGQINSTDARKSAADAALKGLELHQLEAPLDANHLQLLQSRAQTADGQMKAIQYANQLAAFQSNQLLQLKTMMVAQHNVEIAREQARIDKKAMEQAAHETFTKRLSPLNLPQSRSWNVRDGF